MNVKHHRDEDWVLQGDISLLSPDDYWQETKKLCCDVTWKEAQTDCRARPDGAGLL